MQNGKILAIDYGGSKIGLAVSDSGRNMAFGRGVLRLKDKEKVFQEISELIKKESITLIVLGLPLNIEGEDTIQTKRIRSFAEELGLKLKQIETEVPIEFIDESFTTFEANQMLDKIGVPNIDRKSTEDEMAAIILIHRYIDFRP